MIAGRCRAKQLNINAIRTQLITQRQFVSWTQRRKYCLYVIDVILRRTARGARPVTSPPRHRKFEWRACDRSEIGVCQDYNHLVRAHLGNESSWRRGLLLEKHRSHELDPARPVHYEGVTWDRIDDA